MQDLALRGPLSQIFVIAPVLNEIASDTTLNGSKRHLAQAVPAYAQ